MQTTIDITIPKFLKNDIPSYEFLIDLHNVSEYLNHTLPHSLQWAVVSRNSTKSQDAPGGLGISMLLEFLRLNKGGFTLISDNEYLEINQKGKRNGLLQSHFPGTIVSITFNMQDNFSYILKGEDIDTIIL